MNCSNWLGPDRPSIAVLAFDTTVYGCGFSPICAELRRLWRAGVLVVTACGNEDLLQVQTPDGDTQINTAMSIGDPANLAACPI